LLDLGEPLGDDVLEGFGVIQCETD
jgi:hypothetical protein